ncbi:MULTISPECIES: outer membrane protein assembly factor BamA [unclassified Paludibacterium]|uniref:outer membrane protein assembly factor BamA n=1 Tax=unclassified Paludibacterium TaxID=2618429 RepID=UPI001C0528FD|nr:outer membrane protein assembly factor BamA [Paludibacterium sp. B53371]BEV71032.1 outer membrane protein assembly factor BamA [Paludibacterium sp. THUN1379]
MKLKLVAAAVLGLSSAAWAVDPFVIKDIKVEGLQRTEAGTVFNYLPLKVGDTFTDQKASEAIKALFATGFFNDVRVESSNGIVMVEVAERPVIAQLTITGSKEFDKEQLKKALKENGLAESRVFDQGLLDGAVQELKRQYYSRGKYAVEINPHISKLDRNRVSISLDITEGITAKIREIRLVGNQAFDTSTLMDQFSQTTGSWTSWISHDDQYSKQKLTGDLEKLRAFYQNQGYLEFNIDSTQVAIAADKESVYLTINLTEGKRYTLGELRLGGDLKVPEAELRSLLQVKTGQIFNREKVNETVTALTDRLGRDGYAFANVNVVPELDREHDIANLTFFVDPGRRTYVRRINISGNTKSRDEVIRREMRQLEGAYYNSANIKRSKERVDLLGYFEDINIETPAVGDVPDQVDMNLSLKERSTGSISAGIGFVQGEGLQLSAGISQSNVFGSGKTAALNISTGKVNKTLSLSFTDPYYTTDGVSLGYNVYRRQYNPDTINLSEYKTTSSGASVTAGVPVTERDRVNFTLGFDVTNITTFSNSPQQYIDYVNKHGSNSTTLSGGVSWGRDTRDSALWPTRGYTANVSFDAGLPGGNVNYYRLGHSESWFFPLSKTYTLMLGGEVGAINGYGKTSTVPFFDNYYLGGIGSVRGFDSGSMGPKDSNGYALGGTRKMVLNTELLFPFPGMRDNKSVRMSLFGDAGTLWDDKNPSVSASSGFRYSGGLALTWLSPVGPMKFSYAVPMHKQQGDKIQRLQFQLGTVF